MSKHETTNQFKDGLMMDVHPLQTPNSVLTDCLNGTFITYNGNEHVLQNDMGNFKLEKCKLRENYIPIGTASYGDILYIASYNPIEKKFELGSYPSPLQWNSSAEDDSISFDTIISRALANAYANATEDNVDLNFTYSELEEFAVSKVIDDPDMKLNPGDRYKITSELDQSDLYVEGINYFILDENNRKQYVDGIEQNCDFKPISWQMPGYLGITSSILTPYEHKLYVMYTSTGPTSVLYKLRSVISIFDDQLLKPENINQFFANLQLKVDYYIEGENVGSLKYVRPDWLSENGSEENNSGFNVFSDYNLYQWLYDKKQLVYEFDLTIDYPAGDNNKCLYKEFTRDGKKFIEYYERPTEIRATPVLWCSANNNVVGQDVFHIEYDNLKSSITYTANGEDRNAVAESTFTWSAWHKGDGEQKDNVQINFDLFRSNEDVKVAVFWKKLDDLLLNQPFIIPSTLGKIGELTNNEYAIINNGVSTCTLWDLQKDTYVVVFFHFYDDAFPTTTDALRDSKLVARFVYVTDNSKYITQDGRADRLLNLSKELNEKLNDKDDFADHVKVDVDASKPTYKMFSKTSETEAYKEDSALLSSSPSTSLFFAKSNKIWKLTQESTTSTTPVVEGAKSTISLNTGCFENLRVVNKYSTQKDSTNYTTNVNSFTVNVKIDHAVNVVKGSDYYDFSEIASFKGLSTPNTYRVNWITNKGKGRFSPSGDWNNDLASTIFDLDKIYANFTEFSKSFAPYTTADIQMKILTLGAIRKAGAWSRIFSSSAKTSYMCANDKSESSGVYRTFLMVGQESSPGFRLLQFTTDGNDSVDSLKQIASGMGYFIFNSTVSGNFEKKNLYNYTITPGSISEDDLNKKFTLWQKRQIVASSSDNPIFLWIFQGSSNAQLNCYDYCTWDPQSMIQKLSITETAPKQIHTKMTYVGDTFNVTSKDESKQGQKQKLENRWDATFKSVQETVENQSRTYLGYLEWTGRTDKLGMYCTANANDNAKKLAKCLTPHRNTSGLAKLDTNKYSSKYNPNFYFGCTSSGDWKTVVGYIPGSTEWLPS